MEIWKHNMETWKYYGILNENDKLNNWADVFIYVLKGIHLHWEDGPYPFYYRNAGWKKIEENKQEVKSPQYQKYLQYFAIHWELQLIIHKHVRIWQPMVSCITVTGWIYLNQI